MSTVALDDLAGSLRVRPGAALPGSLLSTRRDWASRLVPGQPVAAVPSLVASLFSLCGQAHRLCSQLAIDAAVPGLMPVPADTAQRLRLETAQEHVRRIGLDWPRLLAPGDTAVVGAARAALPGCPLLAPPMETPWPAMADWLEREWLHMPPARWLHAWQACGADWLDDWSRRPAGWLPALVRVARGADSGPALDPGRALRPHTSAPALRRLATSMSAQAGFALAPQVDGTCAHTGSWSRRHDPMDLPLTPWALLGSRLAELVRLCLPDGPGQGARWLSWGACASEPRQGLAWVEMARGLLVHQLEVAPDDAGAVGVVSRVRACRVLAPTEWNFHPAGEVAHRLGALDPQQSQAPAVGLLMAAFDPCVPFQLDATSAATAPTEPEADHA